MRKVTVYKKIPFIMDIDFPLNVFDTVSNITFMHSNKKWSIIASIEYHRPFEYCIVLVPLSNYRFVRAIQKIWIIATYPM